VHRGIRTTTQGVWALSEFDPTSKEVPMRKLAMSLLVAMTLAIGSFSTSAAYAEPLDSHYFYDDSYEFLNPQPLPP
jgi:hypothetical protein